MREEEIVQSAMASEVNSRGHGLCVQAHLCDRRKGQVPTFSSITPNYYLMLQNANSVMTARGLRIDMFRQVFGER